MIELDQLTKRYEKNGKLALDHISYYSDTARPLGIIGSNGAGKSTLFMLANGLAEPTSGCVRLFGRTVSGDRSVKKRTGLFTDKLVLYPMLTVKETVSYFMGMYGIPKREYESRIRMFRIKEFETCKMESLSTGMMKKVLLLISMLHLPEILFLDEPFSGLDMDAKNQLGEAIQYLSREKGVKIVISSHDLFETQVLIQDVLILEAGKIIEAGNFSDLIGKYTKAKKLSVICEEDERILESYGKLLQKRERGQMELRMGMEDLYPFLSNVDRSKVRNIIHNNMSLGDIYEEARKHATGSHAEERDQSTVS